MILIVSNKWDISADFVVRELSNRQHSFFRLNTEDMQRFACTADVTADVWQIVTSRMTLDPEEVEAVWWRRPGKIFDNSPKNERPTDSVVNFVHEQWATWLESFPARASARWVNPLDASFRMENKLTQLRLAKSLGFLIPETVISNDPAVAEKLHRRWRKGVIVKALIGPLLEQPDGDRFIFTNAVSADDILAQPSIRIAPIIFQESLIPKIDYRITVVGERLFPVRIDSNSAVPLDWRTKKEGLAFAPVNLPPEIASLCVSYVREAGLVYGAIDLVEHQGTFYFLEINPNGEWGWLQKPTGLPIAEAICDTLSPA